MRRSSSCSIPIVDGKDSEAYPWVSGLPEPERARGQEPAGKAESGEKTLKPRLGETRVTWRKLDCLKSNPIRSMEGLWLQRLRARWTLSTGKRRACAPSEVQHRAMSAGKGCVDRLPHASTCCVEELRDGLRGESPMVTELP